MADFVDDGRRRRRRSGGSTNLASCLVATAFLLLVAAAAAAVLFVLFHPRDPTIAVSAVQLPGFIAANGSVARGFTFAQHAAVRNPNRAAFSHYDSTLRLVYAGAQVGFMFIPAGQIDAGRTQYMAASFRIEAFPLAPDPSVAASWGTPMGTAAATARGGGGGGGGGGVVEVVSKMRMKGRVRVLKFFTHHAEATAKCHVGVDAGDGSVLGFRC